MKKEQKSAYCPASLSFPFRKIENEDIQKSGSVGIGCAVDKGVVCVGEKNSEYLTQFNGKNIKIPTVDWAIEKILPGKNVKINFASPLPLGCGFGLSAACCLSAVKTTNDLYSLKLPEERIKKICHESEILNKTGLGSVATEITGGFLIKKTPGIFPETIKLNLTGVKIYALVISAIKTPLILSDEKKINEINYQADQALKKINSEKTADLKTILKITWDYCKKSKLADEEIIKIIEKAQKNNINATMAILGKTVLCDKPISHKKGQMIELAITDEKFEI